MNRPPKALWEAALGQLQLQVTRPNYETWLRDSSGLALEDGIFTVCVPTDFVAEWLRDRLSDLITKTLSGIVGQPLRVAFRVDGAPIDGSPLPSLAALSSSEALPPLPKPRLNPLFTFDTFVVADCNRLAHAAASRAANVNGGPQHNPLFLYGESGLGKTHLLHAIAHCLLAAERRVLYVTAEQFLSEFVFAARQKRTDDFRAKYRSLDALLLDDVQFLAGKGGTQEEFFHTFNHLHASGKQLVLASDEPPEALTHFSPRLRSRFQSGLSADLSMFLGNARIALLRKKAESLHAEVDDASLEFLAGRPYCNVRELEGALNRIVAYARLTGQRADVTLARSAIKCDPDAGVSFAAQARERHRRRLLVLRCPSSGPRRAGKKQARHDRSTRRHVPSSTGLLPGSHPHRQALWRPRPFHRPLRLSKDRARVERYSSDSHRPRSHPREANFSCRLISHDSLHPYHQRLHHYVDFCGNGLRRLRTLHRGPSLFDTVGRAPLFVFLVFTTFPADT